MAQRTPWMSTQLQNNPTAALGGMALGAGTMGGLSGLFGGGGMMGKSERVMQSPLMNPQQQQIFSQLLGKLGGQNFDFGPIEDAARNNFTSKTVPGIAERFTAMGDNRGGSNYMGALGEAGAGLELGLGAMKQNYNFQQQGQLQNLLGMNTFENTIMPRQPGGLEGGLQAIMSLLPLLAFL